MFRTTNDHQRASKCNRLRPTDSCIYTAAMSLLWFMVLLHITIASSRYRSSPSWYNIQQPAYKLMQTFSIVVPRYSLNFHSSCDAGQRQFITEAYEDALDLAAEAYGALQSSDGLYQSIFRRWFGRNEHHKQVVTDVFGRMSRLKWLLRGEVMH